MYLCLRELIRYANREKKNSVPIGNRDLKTVFLGNLTTMRRHVAREGMDHYSIYEKRCKERNIAMHDTAIPKEEKQRRDHESECV